MTFDNLRSQVRLFLSVDAIGSSAFKYSTDPEKVAKWIKSFEAFYDSFEECINEAYLESESLDVPELWKPLGDELVYTVEIKDENEANRQIKRIIKAIQSYSKRVNDSEKPDQLFIKSTAWIAGIPAINKEMPIQYPDGEFRTDYIGPSIDAGFRLAKFSSKRKMAISVDLALLLTHPELKDGIERKLFHFEGREPLKGIYGNKPYPIIWMNVERDDKSSFETLEASLTSDTSQVKSTELLHDYCSKFIDEIVHGAQLIRPYFTENKSSLFYREKPIDDHVKIIEAIKRSSPEKLDIDIPESNGDSSINDVPNLEDF